LPIPEPARPVVARAATIAEPALPVPEPAASRGLVRVGSTGSADIAAPELPPALPRHDDELAPPALRPAAAHREDVDAGPVRSDTVAADWLAGAPMVDDLVPDATAVHRRTRRDVRARRSGRRRRIAIFAGALAIAGVAIGVWVGNDHGGSAASVGTAGGHRTGHATAGTKPSPTPTTAPGAAANGATSAGAAVGAAGTTPATSPQSGAGTSPATAVPGGFPNDPLAGLTLATTSGSCRWDGDNFEVVASGTVRNSSDQDTQAEVEVTWADQSGELGTDSSLVDVSAHSTEPWDVSSPQPDAPQGSLSCHADFVP
ncbi:MAG: hypothetical protein ACXV9S_17855, partial [Acidimicrobiia bacterium]